MMQESTCLKNLEARNENKDLSCFGISNNINECFFAINGQSKLMNGGHEKPLTKDHTRDCLSRKETCSSSCMRKVSDVTSTSKSNSVDNLKYAEQPTQFLGNKRRSPLTKEDKALMKLERNRLSAQKSRQKKKAYMSELEEKLNQMEEELNHYKKLSSSKKSTLESKLENLKTKENNYLIFFNSCNFKSTVNSIEEKRKMQTDYTIMQNGLIVELYKGLIKNMVPLDIRYFEMKCPMLKDIYNFTSIENLMENLRDNQFMLNEAYNFQFLPEQAISFPLHVYMFYEQIIKFTLNFKEYLLKVRKFNI
jgi:hypothetical protein